MERRDFDVLIVGAGLSGICAARHLQARCPRKTYAILEGREQSGGTWDLFRYPGVRSDSDMYTLGYSFKPWKHEKSIADGATILSYIRETASEFGIDRHVRYGMRAQRASWSGKNARWTVEVQRAGEEGTLWFTCSFLFLCVGYYDYAEGYAPEFPGRERFAGRVVHPQHWTEDLDYAGKRVVVIGSGATAVTLVPELAKSAAHVTMLQRSPTYIVSIPAKDPLANALRRVLPARAAHALARWKNVLFAMGFFALGRRFPHLAKRIMVKHVRRLLAGKADIRRDFTPSYDPWDQRLCMVPDGDLFTAVREGRVSVVTDHIESFTESGLRLRSGRELQADLIVTATGLKLRALGGITIEVDGGHVNLAETMAYRGMMLSDVPNLAYALGYTNASWTLKCELTAEYLCRLINHMDAKGIAQYCPRRRDPRVREAPLFDLSSGYVQRGIGAFPRQGSLAPWRLYDNYLLDYLLIRHSALEDGTQEFVRSSSESSQHASTQTLSDPLCIAPRESISEKSAEM